jgi:hypothetical protein
MDAKACDWNQSPPIAAGCISSNSELPVAYSLFAAYSRSFVSMLAGVSGEPLLKVLMNLTNCAGEPPSL